ncbi:MAG: hypothetical protein COA43_04880 [Robiginitomaculum sp.]|nr:MAG: hypothetical protein COA43_04880 [Robiginitomaculum sp.]
MRVDTDNAFDTILAPDNGAVTVAPKPSDYLDELDGEDMTEAQKIEYLTIIFNVMKCFVEIGFGANSIPRLISETGSSSRISTENGVELTQSKYMPTFNKSAFDKDAVRRVYEPSPKHP